MRKTVRLKIPRQKFRISVGDINFFAHYIFKMVKFDRVKNFFKVDQISVPDYQ